MSTISSIALKDVLLARPLCDLLGYHRGSTTRPQTKLLDAVRSCRRNHPTRDGVAGKDLQSWQSPVVREQLQQLAIDFLDSGHGAELWPATGRPLPREVPEYPIDKDRIIPLFCQLIWRQNKIQYHNDIHLAKERLARLHGRSVEDGSIPPHSTQEDGSSPSRAESGRKMAKHSIRNNSPATDDKAHVDSSNTAAVVNTLPRNEPMPAQQQPSTQVGPNAVMVEKRLKPTPSDDVPEQVDTEDKGEIRMNQNELVMIIPCRRSFLRRLTTLKPDIPIAKTVISDARPMEQTVTQCSNSSGSSDCSVSSESDVSRGRSALPTPSSNGQPQWTMVTRSAILHNSEHVRRTITNSVTDDSTKYPSPPIRSCEKIFPSPESEDSRPSGDAPKNSLQDIQKNTSPQDQQQTNYSRSKIANAPSSTDPIDPEQMSQLTASPRAAWQTSLETEQNASPSNTSISPEPEKDSCNSTGRPAKRVKLVSGQSTATGDNSDNVRNWANTLLEDQYVQSEIHHDSEQANCKSPHSGNQTFAAQTVKRILSEPLGISPPPYQSIHIENECKREAERCSRETKVLKRKATVEQQIPHIRFVIINLIGKSRITREWPIGTFGDRTLENVFVHVTKVIGRDTQSLLFRLHLNASLDISENVMDRGDEDGFTEMRRRLSDAVRKNMRQTKQSEYLIEIVPEPEEEQATLTADDDDLDVEEVQFI